MKYHPLTIEIRSAFKVAANPEEAPAMQSYVKSELLFYGVKSPARKEIYKILFNKHGIADSTEYERIIRELWDAGYHEERYAAISFAVRYKKFHTLEALQLYRMMIISGAWWDLVDGIACDLINPLLKKFQHEMKERLKQWIKDDDIWIRRTAILSQLRFKSDTDHKMLFDFCKQCLHEKSFWIRKAIGWALREYSKSEPDRVRMFVDENREAMSGLSLKEASKYI
ncbi:MAG: DNA alkylation repair protein [Calditrichaeota bacterium]|nr:DNA alkylation repair protein [Calditrichota bacterium]